MSFRHSERSARPSLMQQAIRFAMSTGVSAGLSFGLPVALVEIFGVHEPRAVQIGFLVAYLANLMLLRQFVYRSRNDWRRDVVRYIVVNAIFRLAEYFAFILLFENAGIAYSLALLAVLAISSLVKFFVYRLVFASAGNAESRAA